MRSINDYIIYCTEEQTRKALELGVPIIMALYPSTWFEEVHPMRCHIDVPENPNGCTLAIPTAEQMIGWLEEKNMIIEISFRGTDEPDKKGNKMYIYHLFDLKEWEELNPLSDLYRSRKEATIAAIDAALEYLINNNK